MKLPYMVIANAAIYYAMQQKRRRLSLNYTHPLPSILTPEGFAAWNRAEKVKWEREKHIR